MSDLVNHAEALSRHQYGNFVVQHLLEHGSSLHRAKVVQCLLPFLPSLSMHRNACHVVQQALNHSSAQGQREMADALLWAEEPHTFAKLVSNRYGSYVAEELLNVFGTKGPGWEAQVLLQEIMAAPGQRENNCFLRVAGKYGLAAHDGTIV